MRRRSWRGGRRGIGKDVGKDRTGNWRCGVDGVMARAMMLAGWCGERRE
jgi:hypothetical protein